VKLLLNYLTTLPSEFVKSGLGKGVVEDFTSAIFVCLQSFSSCFEKLFDLSHYINTWVDELKTEIMPVSVLEGNEPFTERKKSILGCYLELINTLLNQL
jgi:hypothetical protein